MDLWPQVDFSFGAKFRIDRAPPKITAIKKKAVSRPGNIPPKGLPMDWSVMI
jgi:hypothetical protein